MIIYLDKQYGLNASTIEFIPYCKDEIEVANTITCEDYSLTCIGKNQFKLLTNNPNDSILGEILLNNEWKKKKYE